MTSESIDIHLDIGNMEVTRAGAVSCTLYLEIGNTFFPEKGWTDLASKLVPVWSEQLAVLLNSDIGVVDCHFMEGPFFFYVSTDGDRDLTIELVKRQLRGNKSSAHRVLVNDFVTRLLVAANTLIQVAEEGKLAGDDYDNLRKAVATLETLRVTRSLH